MGRQISRGQASQTIFFASHRQRGCFTACRPTGVARGCCSASRERRRYSASAFACWRAPRGRGDAAAGSATRVQNWAAWDCVPRPRKEASAQASAERHILCNVFQIVSSPYAARFKLFQTVPNCSELFRTVSDVSTWGAPWTSARPARPCPPTASNSFRLFQAVSSCSDLPQTVSNGFKSLSRRPDKRRLFRFVSNTLTK